MAARCHWSWWSTSATDSRYLWRIPSTIGRTAPRFAFSDRLSGTWRSKQTAAACTTPLWRAGVEMWASALGDEQAADVLDPRGAGDGPRPDAGGHLELLGAFVPEPRLEAGEAGRARVDADLGRR